MKNATAIIHTASAMGAKFTQYTVEFEAGGELPPATMQRFLFVLAGEVNVGGETLGPNGYAYNSGAVTSTSAARVTVIEKPYQPLPGIVAPSAFSGYESSIPGQPLGGDPDIEVRLLMPADSAFDFAVNTMTFRPGAALSMVEVHVMEHGLLFLEGGGIYRLGNDWDPVKQGDFIYMAPYCPQWFGALGKTDAKYLIYKDWNRAAQ
jgi:(S)-ureidoglycine aminohydrolase